MMHVPFASLISLLVMVLAGCQPAPVPKEKTAADLLGDPASLAISYGGYRENTRDIQPTIEQIREDLLILSAMGVKLLRTYNVHLDEAANLLEAIRQTKQADPEFEMYVMLGAWIDCKNAWTQFPPEHGLESERNAKEIARAVELAQQYPEVVKIMAVGNEAMVKWAASYYVEPGIILKWVRHLQALKAQGQLPETLWITSSDNFASWGGGGAEYHVPELDSLIHAVDFISMHTYPMHDTHYNPAFWQDSAANDARSDADKIEAAMLRAREYAVAQYDSVAAYMQKVGANKPIHIGETGWASFANERYGDEGSRATDEYKSALYYRHMREWTASKRMACFYFEAFDESWKDSANPGGSENHFGLINLKGEAKYALWDLVDAGAFEGLTRGGKPITKTFGGSLDSLLLTVKTPPAPPASE